MRRAEPSTWATDRVFPSVGSRNAVQARVSGGHEGGEGRIKTQLGAFAIAGSGLYVGKDPGEAITEDHPDVPPHAFTCGAINQVAVDVSGDPYVDVECETALMLMRE